MHIFLSRLFLFRWTIKVWYNNCIVFTVFILYIKLRQLFNSPNNTWHDCTLAHRPEGRTNEGQWPEPNLRPKPKSHFTFFSSFSKGRGPASAQSCHFTRPSALNNLHLVKILSHLKKLKILSFGITCLRKLFETQNYFYRAISIHAFKTFHIYFKLETAAT